MKKGGFDIRQTKSDKDKMESLKIFNENLEKIKKRSKIYQTRNADRYKGSEM
jgi:hypothetical protein